MPEDDRFIGYYSQKNIIVKNEMEAMKYYEKKSKFDSDFFIINKLCVNH